ncbi:Gfo/Idh/MocA family protein [Anditalea andensis]|uniref:NAD-binding oxidoreductase n=1 Tax=Anditalea andensis TaxID=1048983 RepID=A0A074KWG6_9BACT|nr:Gfo/Idh/MocA family oxidoreductase [Anditalea andensis]KEO73274.1 NAD-binding oxidoreductase [Anditalea andensis]
MNKLKTGLVGYGSVAEKMHAPLIHTSPYMDLYGVVERNHRRSKDKYAEVKIFRSIEELLLVEELDLVVIATPNENHYGQAKLALEAGKHVVVDKPITVSAADAISLDRLAKDKGLVLSVFQNRRWDGDFLTVQKLMHEGILGRIVHFESHFDRFRPEPKENWREKDVPGSGILYDLGSHLIDQALMLFGKPDWVYAEILKQRPHVEADDFFDISMQFDGVKVRLTASIYVNAVLPKFMLLGEKGTYIKHGLDVQEQAFKEQRLPVGETWGIEPEINWGKIYFEDKQVAFPTLNGDYRQLYENIARAILANDPLAVTAQQAIDCLKVIEACKVSHEEGRRVAGDEIFR